MDADPADVAAIQQLLIDRERLPPCEECQQQSVFRVVYGYPSSGDLSLFSIYGGMESDAESPTHYCQNCTRLWRDDSADSLDLPFPIHCYFCNEPLAPMDKFAHQMLFESWVESVDMPLQLEDQVSETDLYPTCSQCKESIQCNTNELHADRLRSENQAFITREMALIGLFIFVLSVVVVAMIG